MFCDQTNSYLTFRKVKPVKPFKEKNVKLKKHIRVILHHSETPRRFEFEAEGFRTQAHLFSNKKLGRKSSKHLFVEGFLAFVKNSAIFDESNESNRSCFEILSRK